MVLMVPFTRAATDAATTAPFTAVAEIVTAKPTGAACTELAEMAAAKTPAVRTTPRLVNQLPQFFHRAVGWTLSRCKKRERTPRTWSTGPIAHPSVCNVHVNETITTVGV